MAEEAAEENEAGGGDGGGVLKKWGPLAAIVMLAQAIIAFVLIEFVLRDNVPEQPQEQLMPENSSVEIRQIQPKKEDVRDRLPFIYDSPKVLRTITANPAGTNSERFVVLSVQLGLEAYNTEESPPDDDITGALKDNTTVLEKIALYDLKIKALITSIIRGKTVDELDAQFQNELEGEMRDVLNREIFDRLFKIDEENKTKVRIVEVNISDIIIQ